MLGKLIKHEWKGTYKVGCILLLSTFMITIIGYFALHLPFMIGGVNFTSVTTVIIGLLGYIVLILGLMGILYGIMIYLGIRFYKNMYGDEGYLTHTLPATSYQLMGSKVIVGGIWTMIIMMVIMLAVVILTVAFEEMMSGQQMGMAEIFREMKQIMDSDMEGGFGMYVAYFVTSFLLGPFLGMTTLYGSVTMGQLFRKHRGIMAIVCYLMVTFASGIISMIVTVPVMMGEVTKAEAYGTVNVSVSGSANYYVTLGISVIISIVMFFVACHIDDKKLNME